MIFRAFLTSLEQIWHPSFRRVFIMGVSITLVVFVVLFWALLELWPEDVALTGWWIIDAPLNWLLDFSVFPTVFAFLFLSWFLFPAVATLVLSFFLDQIVTAVEEEHYPDVEASGPTSLSRGTYLAARMGLVVLLVNFLALPAYLLLLFTAVGPFILFFLLNSFLMGREYYALVSERHFQPDDSKRPARAKPDQIFLGGGLVMALFLIPVLNLAAPILGAATMTHIYHAAREQQTESP